MEVEEAYSPVSPDGLPTDLQLCIAASLDGKSLATFCECTSKTLCEATSPHLDVFWKDLLRALPADAPAPTTPRTGDSKSKYVHAWAVAHAACPRCGRVSRRLPSADELVMEDGYAQTQRHLCDYFASPPARSEQLQQRCVQMQTQMHVQPERMEDEQAAAVATSRSLQQQSLTSWLVRAPVQQPAMDLS